METIGRAFALTDAEGTPRKTRHGGRLYGLGVTCRVEKSKDEDTIRMTASTEDTDRHGDIIKADGWKLDAYLKNPVILWGHDHGIPAVAKALKTFVKDGALIQEWHFPKELREAHELSNLLYIGYKHGVYNASSVGFQPLIWEEQEKSDEEGGSPFPSYVFTKQELYEVSAVNVPANPHALQEMRAKGIDTRALEELITRGEGHVIQLSDNLDPKNLTVDEDADSVLDDPDFWESVLSIRDQAPGAVDDALPDDIEDDLAFHFADGDDTTPGITLTIVAREPDEMRAMLTDALRAFDGETCPACYEKGCDQFDALIEDEPITFDIDPKPEPVDDETAMKAVELFDAFMEWKDVQLMKRVEKRATEAVNYKLGLLPKNKE